MQLKRKSSVLCIYFNFINTRKRHNQGVKKIRWSNTGNYFISSAKDRFVNIFDLRKLDQEVFKINLQTQADAISWHPIYDNIFMTGDQTGAIQYWNILYIQTIVKVAPPRSPSSKFKSKTRRFKILILTVLGSSWLAYDRFRTKKINASSLRSSCSLSEIVFTCRVVLNIEIKKKNRKQKL